jgi:hypothetical protein
MAAGRISRARGLIVNGLLLLAGAALFVAPRILEARGALLWARYQAGRTAGSHPAEHARLAVRAAVRALDLAAPLPMAAEAARVALDATHDLETRDAAAALPLYAELRGALERVLAVPLRGSGLEGPLAEAHAGEERARAARDRAPR